MTIQWVPRGVAGLFGATGMVAGAVAVFITDNGAGAAALMTVGLLLFVLFVVGRITSFKYGDAELVFNLVEQAARAQEAGEEGLADTLLESALHAASAADSESAYRDAVEEDAQRGRPADVKVVRPDFSARRRQESYPPNSIHVGLAVKLRLTKTALQHLLYEMKGRDDMGELGYDGLLVVARELSDEAQDFMSAFEEQSPVPVQIQELREPGIARLTDARWLLVEKVKAKASAEEH